MSKRDDTVSLNDMLSHSREAVQLLTGTSREAFGRDRVLQLASTRLIEIVGEAANRITSEGRQAHPEIPWNRIVGMRNRLVHGYDVIDYDLLWDTVTCDLPPLIESLNKALKNR